MISINMIGLECWYDIVITYDWLTDDFEFHKILLYINDLDSFMNNDIFIDRIYKVLDKWELINLKFINCCPYYLDLYYDRSMLKGKNEDIIIYENRDNCDDLIKHSLKKWAKENNYTQEMSNIITAIINVLVFDNNDQIVEKINCNCIYHKIEFFASIGQPFKLLLDKLPFSIFPKLLQLFKPLKHVKVITMKKLRDMLINAFNILNDNEMTYQHYWELETLKSFLTFLINSYLDLHQRVGFFLDPNSKSIFINDSAVKKLVLDECQDYYSKIDNNSRQELANGELERYNKLPQVLINEDDPCKWWQKSKHLYPGLATLALKYLPLLKLDDKEVSLENHDEFKDVYDDNYETINKIAFLQYNMKYIDL
ncbi:hypothetical protein C2G38_2100300 [Gigaspora rosea]|uniref:HAT C-terminal dimerisation domain-containing protein n=1 Tax=Gigaspora rosea TaxID=44941 RepID=A0A397USA3_9GLOM|nr:hypothetical protein C2G38_2100300 [Gigaspora rosea]